MHDCMCVSCNGCRQKDHPKKEGEDQVLGITNLKSFQVSTTSNLSNALFNKKK